MKKNNFFSIFVAAAVSAAVVSACSPEPAPPSPISPIKTTSPVEQNPKENKASEDVQEVKSVTVSSKPGSDPNPEYSQIVQGVDISRTEVHVPEKGKKVGANSLVSANVWVYDSSGVEPGGSTSMILNMGSSKSTITDKILWGSRKGSRVLAVTKSVPEELVATGQALPASNGLYYIIVVDVVKVIPLDSGIPSKKMDEGKIPEGLTITDEIKNDRLTNTSLRTKSSAEEPVKSGRHVLIKGEGKALEDSNGEVLIHRTTVDWSGTIKPYSTWVNKTPELMPVMGTEDQIDFTEYTVGSRILDVTPGVSKNGSWSSSKISVIDIIELL